jgi:hypothetical protein
MAGLIVYVSSSRIIESLGTLGRPTQDSEGIDRSLRRLCGNLRQFIYVRNCPRRLWVYRCSTWSHFAYIKPRRLCIRHTRHCWNMYKHYTQYVFQNIRLSIRCADLFIPGRLGCKWPLALLFSNALIMNQIQWTIWLPRSYLRSMHSVNGTDSWSSILLECCVFILTVVSLQRHSRDRGLLGISPLVRTLYRDGQLHIPLRHLF